MEKACCKVPFATEKANLAQLQATNSNVKKCSKVDPSLSKPEA